MSAVTTTTTPLVNVPTPLADEAASSWLSRFAISQGADLKTALAFLEIPAARDLDTQMVGALLAAVRLKCGLPDDALACHERVMGRLPELGSLSEDLLTTTRSGRPLTQFCRYCVYEMRTPYFPIHWRFSVWQWCPLHDCQIDVVCPHCQTRPRPLVDIAETRAGKQGIANLNRCLHCSKPLGAPIGTSHDSRKLADLLPEKRRRLANGRALLAALYHGWFGTKDQTVKIPISAIKDMATLDDFPRPPPRMDRYRPRARQREQSRWRVSYASRLFRGGHGLSTDLLDY